MADIKQVVEKVKGAQNILVALSKNPSVDEVSAALGLTLMLDKIGKKATAIYSGETPDVLRFLNPEKTFSTDTNALQDFIIALDKDKADHLRYKVDGDYVKVFITPYHEAISESDLEYSYGDFNVDLIIALDVAEEKDLDGALVEYGRIMHDAGVINITTSSGGKFSEMEWSNPEASSVSEMITELGAELAEDAFEKNSATALLTGIVASTERFANEKTTPETMGAAAKLMKAGAEQRLIAENMERVEKGQSPVPLDDAFSEESPSSEDALSSPFSDDSPSSEDALLPRRTSSTARSATPSSSDNLSENELEGREISENASDEKSEEESTEETAEEPEKETTEGTTEKTEEEPEEKLAEEPAEEESAEGEKSAEKEPETPEKEEPAVDLQAAAEMTKNETEDTPEEEPQKPILETPIELADSGSFSDDSSSSEDALSSSFSEGISASEDALLASLRSRVPRGEQRTESASRSGAPSSLNSQSENGLEDKSEEKSAEELAEEAPIEEKPEEKPVEEAPVETPKVELSGRAEPAKEKMEDATHKTVKLQPSAEAQAELEEIMKEEPKKNELLDELNKYTGDQATSGGLKPDVGLSSIDTDNIGKTEVKDYSQMMSEALDGDGGMPNPAVQAAPAVMTGPEANHIPEMDYSQVSNAEAEQPPMMQNGMLESEPSEKPVGAAKEGMTAETEPTEAQAPGMMAPSEGMTEDILPPPPAPPVDGGVMPPTEPSAIPTPVAPTVPVAPVEPVAPAPVETPPMATPVTPVVPVVPTTPAAPASTPAEAPAQVGPTPTNDDPAAFRIPGM